MICGFMSFFVRGQSSKNLAETPASEGTASDFLMNSAKQRLARALTGFLLSNVGSWFSRFWAFIKWLLVALMFCSPRRDGGRRQASQEVPKGKHHFSPKYVLQRSPARRQIQLVELQHDRAVPDRRCGTDFWIGRA